MPSELASWQSRLEEHFSELHSRRRSRAGRPIFALEHGLDTDEIDALSKAIRTSSAHGPPSAAHWLPWIAYASEIGYQYSGDEYWQTFEQATPGWLVHGDRYSIRRFYRKFHETFGGAKPTGAWAEHFSIICWPITHAILPKDLQRQLARILYELRHLFSAEVLESPAILGELVAARSWNATSRFQHFAEEELLVGQIATALLLKEELLDDALILPTTLNRIRRDLDSERRAREWLGKARRMANERATVRGLASLHSAIRAKRHEEARAEVAELGIEPRLILSPAGEGTDLWEVLLEIPDLSHLGLRFPRSRRVLAGSRLQVAGATGRPLARGRCLHGAQRIRLAVWPNQGQVLLKFEDSDPELDYLLSTDCLIRPGPVWLFRLASDGLAYESRGLRVRPGNRYLVVRRGEADSQTHLARSTAIDCDGVSALRLDIPEALDSEWENCLRSLGLQQAKAVEVWPAGLAAVSWDGEGRGDWLAGERPMLAVRADHTVDTLAIAIDSSQHPQLEVTPVTPGHILFVELPDLPLGLHTVRFSSSRGGVSGLEPVGELDVVIRIREARPWSPGISPNGPLQVVIDPPSPSIEELWEGRVDIAVTGPPGRRLNSRVCFYERHGERPTFDERLPPLTLAVDSDQWRQHFFRHCRDRRNAQNAYDAARVAEVTFSADELGEFDLRFERAFTPLRWILRRGNSHNYVRLINDSGMRDPPIVSYTAFERPIDHAILPLNSEYEVPSAGGLYVAGLDTSRVALISPPTIRDLRDLCCTPQISLGPRAVRTVTQVLESAALWGNARLPGDVISEKRQRDVLDAITAAILEIVGGENWARAERASRKNGSLALLKDAVTKRRDEAALGVILVRDASDIAHSTCMELVGKLTALAKRYLSLRGGISEKSSGECSTETEFKNASDPQWITELALRLASEVEGVAKWAGEELGAGVKRLMEELPTLARAARLMVLASSVDYGDTISESRSTTNWRWQ